MFSSEIVFYGVTCFAGDVKLGTSRLKIVHTLLKGGNSSGDRNIESDIRVNHNGG